MAIKISLFIATVFYAVIISQSLFYILAMSTVMKKMQAAVFIQTRQLLDAKLQTTLYLAYYLALASSIALLISAVAIFSVDLPGILMGGVVKLSFVPGVNPAFAISLLADLLLRI